MKIPIHMDALSGNKGRQDGTGLHENLILAAQKGDFVARDKLVAHFMPLITRMAKKRSEELSEINRLIEGGKGGVLHAARKYKTRIGAAGFKMFAVSHIEAGMQGSAGRRNSLLGWLRKRA